MDKYLNATPELVSKIVLMNTNNAQTPFIITEYTGFSENIVSFQTFTFSLKKYLLILLDDDSLIVRKINDDATYTH